MVLGCGLVIASVTLGLTDFVSSRDLSARDCRPRLGWRNWPDQELDRRRLLAGVSHLQSCRLRTETGTDHVPPGKEMNALTSLSEIVDVVIGVDTHVDIIVPQPLM